ncbi:Gfo/Idh/MocA family protein [Oscillospiraceae bacterium LTW-04]|nr:Gfo/Idh/MocA family oxidoreductase [Oscillospiraceae bacterium MB24-C1]
MKVCFCGLGSIGRRHLKNLTHLASAFGTMPEIHALRKTSNALDKDIEKLLAKQFADVRELDQDYDLAFITNPTSLHFETMKLMAKRANHLFIEKPIFDSGSYNIGEIESSPTGVYYVAGPLRYAPVIQALKKMINNQSVYCVRVICSSYLPDWRPGADYRQGYSAQKALGGGVDIDLIHEWDYIIALFGFPRKVHRICGKYSSLDIDANDTAVYIAEYENMVAELHLDYFGREPRREIELFTEQGSIIGDLIKNTITFSDGRPPIQFSESENDIYLREMRFFLDCIRSGRAFNNIGHCCAVLDVALGRGTS